MFDFQPITVEAIRTFEPYLCGHNGRFCDFTPSNLFVWRDYYYKAYAVLDGMLVFELWGEDGDTFYSLPMGNGDTERVLTALKAYVENNGQTLKLSLVPEESLPLVRRVLGEHLDITSERDWCDYLYDAPTMAAFAGSAYAKQRNHVRRFDRAYPFYTVERLNTSHLPMLYRFLDSFSTVRGKDSALAAEEVERTRAALAHFEALGLFGVVLLIDGQVVGFSAGAKVCDTLYVNFEKADTAYDGIYQKLVQCFASAFVDDSVRFINREEDCGDEGLRKSKLAYHPCCLLEKYTVTGR